MAKSYNYKMHSAEHLLNQAMVRRFACSRCFSAHINPKKSKCDYYFDRPLTPGEIEAVQEDVNQAIDADLPVTMEEMPKDKALEEFNLDRVPDMEKMSHFRVVRMGDYDACPCIGEHVSSTQEIGRFAITSTGFEEGVLRIRFKLK
ncbi:hypothetical protein [Desulfospira joergensenii]|uniref:hypothetical protein n=1 Tax=Desulfospira joergensenii TaxID=53329 RepID=UPI0003B3CB9D|nr:hypothetical protein [Desulfospira joergensenii]